MALFATVYLSLMGPDGMREVNEAGAANARWLLERIEATGKARMAWPDAPWLNEFVLDTDATVDDVISGGIDRGVLPGVKIGDHRILVAVTEMRTETEMQSLVDIFASI